MSKGKPGTKSTFSERSSPRLERTPPQTERLTPEIERLTGSLKNLVAHHYRVFRKRRGALIRKMRMKRGLRQGDLGAPSQIRKLESGQVSDVCTIEVLKKLKPCMREMMKMFKLISETIPVECQHCRAKCKYQDLVTTHLLGEHFSELTIEYEKDFEDEK